MFSSKDGPVDVDAPIAAAAAAEVRQIDDLPEELKTEIARYCYEQDNKDRELSRRALLRPAIKPVESLGALFRTSRTWSRVVSFKQVASAAFRLDNAPARGPLFRHVSGTQVGPSSVSDWRKYIGVLPSLPNVSSVDLYLFGDFLSTTFDRPGHYAVKGDCDDAPSIASSEEVRRVV
ncbi:hypothetical protein BMF94_3368 [Rhodotorula taiwanensis]|uniref:F-box domain-containing protein n=1 Tax=Rhodotorula taiwanensis TaxID=741276 RepID=A0A2S5BAN4_9BASI|nr:hypothetical protein BMF94_3368 [Rhodotorula taiwanensis]